YNIKSAAERAAIITRQLLAHDGGKTNEPKVVDINAFILDNHKMLRRLVGEKIGLVILPNPETGRVKLDKGLFGLVLMNLVVNARDAMPNGGEITIEAGNVRLDENNLRDLSGLAPGDYVRLGISDTGMGMTTEVREHLFEPFFTTKEEGERKGLGLATCYG